MPLTTSRIAGFNFDFYRLLLTVVIDDLLSKLQNEPLLDFLCRFLLGVKMIFSEPVILLVSSNLNKLFLSEIVKKRI